MSEEVLIEWLFKFLSFCAGLIGDIISVFVTLWILWFVCYLIFRFLVCENDEEEWKEMSGYMRSGMKDLARTFCAAMPGVYRSVKNWADDKLRKEDKDG